MRLLRQFLASSKRERRWPWGGLGLAVLGLGLWALDRACPPPDVQTLAYSTVIVDREGRLLRPYALETGRWRLALQLKQVDPLLQRMVIAYEDKRFYHHIGIDPLSTARALKQLVSNGHIVSGGSTLTMQVARLLEPREERSALAKLKQMARAVQLEMRYSKPEILQLYFTLAPYGGNLEGVRAASLAWFNKEPQKLTVAEAALLVAMPQSPEGRRPDKYPQRIKRARDRVIHRLATAGVIEPVDAELAVQAPLPELRHDFPVLAAHAADRAKRQGSTQLTIAAPLQVQVESLVQEAAKAQGPTISIAVIVADIKTGEILARVGAPRPFDQQSRGWVDMTRAVRSPGSTLKPFIYGLAFQNGIAHPDTLIEDRAENFSGYNPKNFNENFHGTISLRKALQQSLNLPAVQVLDAVGPLRLAASFRNIGVGFKLPRDTPPTLAVALGGVGLTLEDLMTLYSTLPRGGVPFTLHETLKSAVPDQSSAAQEIFGSTASWYVSDILAGTAPPDGLEALDVAYKTGTSYGYRDAWAIGFDKAHVTGVWVGRADGTAVSDMTGRTAAAPLLYRIFGLLKPQGKTVKGPSPASVIAEGDELPVTLKHFGKMLPRDKPTLPPPEILYPPEGADIDAVQLANGKTPPLVIKVAGGAAPYRVLINGLPRPKSFRGPTLNVEEIPQGYTSLTVIDAAGQAATVNVHLQ